jgi:hypothetical protein
MPAKTDPNYLKDYDKLDKWDKIRYYDGDRWCRICKCYHKAKEFNWTSRDGVYYRRGECRLTFRRPPRVEDINEQAYALAAREAYKELV